MNLDDLPDKGAWVKSRPECVQKLFHEFPIGTTVKTEKGILYLIGYTESDELIMSDVNPFGPDADYDEAFSDAHKKYICAQHLRDNSAR